MVPHAVSEILHWVQIKHLSTAQLKKYEVSLLSPSHIEIKHCNILNPATLLLLHSESGEYNDKDAHDCLELMQNEMQGLENVTSDPIPIADFEFFVNGSWYCQDG